MIYFWTFPLFYYSKEDRHPALHHVNCYDPLIPLGLVRNEWGHGKVAMTPKYPNPALQINKSHTNITLMFLWSSNKLNQSIKLSLFPCTNEISCQSKPLAQDFGKCPVIFNFTPFSRCMYEILVFRSQTFSNPPFRGIIRLLSFS